MPVNDGEGRAGADGGRAGERVIRVRIRGTFDKDTDRVDLEEWLSHEEWFHECAVDGHLRIEHAADTSGDVEGAAVHGPPMAPSLDEVILIVVSVAMTPIFDDLYRSAKAAVSAWRDNRRMLSEDGEDPEVDIEADSEER